MGEKVEKVSGSFLSGFVVTGTSVLPRLTRRIDSLNTPATVSGANATYTAAQIARGIILRDTTAGNRTDTLPTAASIITGIANVYTLPQNQDTITFGIQVSGGNTLTLAAGANSTLQGDFIIPTGGFRLITVNRNSSTTVIITAVNPYAPPGVVPVRGSVLTTGGAQTYSITQYLGGYIARDPNGTAVTDITPTAVDLAASLPYLPVGGFFDVTIKNTADAAETITLNGGVGVTLIGAITVAQSQTAVLRNIKTGSATFDVVKLG